MASSCMAAARLVAEELAKEPDTGTQFAGWSPDGKTAIISTGWQSPENAKWEEEHKQFRMEEGRWKLDSCLFDLASGEIANVTAVERVSHYNGGLFYFPGGKQLGFTPLIKGVMADNYFMPVNATREDEALGTVAGAWMGGMRGIVMMQTSGFALIANALASLIVPYQIPAIMVVSERGTMGEFNIGQVLVARTMRPVLDSLAVAHHTLADESNLRFVVDRSIKQAMLTQSPVVFICRRS